MSETRVWVVRTNDDDGWPIEGVFDELRRGRARIGWSYQDNLDLRKIDRKIRNGESLTPDEAWGKKGAGGCLSFFTEMRECDFVLYPHQPERGKLSVVQLTGGYDYDDGINGGDFRSVRPCKLLTDKPLDMYDEIVPAGFRSLKALWAFSRIKKVIDGNLLEGFPDFLASLPEAGQIQDGSGRGGIRRIHAKLGKGLPAAIQEQFNRASLTRQFCSQLFERMGYDYVVQEGPGEAGSDIVVMVGDLLLPEEGFRVGVQVFAFEGDVHGGSLEGKLNQLLAGWETNDLDYGVLLTAGTPTDEARAVLDSHNKEHPQRHVKLIDGNMLADLFLQHFPPG